jgi:peptide/nickel transport system substrate-binding protein
VTPAVAEDYEVSKDATVYTFNLRDGITFHDGNPVTAEDVKYSLERSREINGEASPLNAISDITPLNNMTQLTELNLAGNNITDISTLKNLKNLIDVSLSSNPITDWSPVDHVETVWGRD